MMNSGYRIQDQEGMHFITITVVDWVDVFSRQNYREVMIDSLRYCIRSKGMILYAYVIMSNHLHLVVQSETGKLSDLLRDFKKFTSKRIINLINSEPESRREWILHRFRRAAQHHHRNSVFQVWQYGNHAEEIYSESFLWSKLDYTHLNPVRAGIVEKASHYLYSSASNYVSGNGILREIEVAASPLTDTRKSQEWLRFDSY